MGDDGLGKLGSSVNEVLCRRLRSSGAVCWCMTSNSLRDGELDREARVMYAAGGANTTGEVIAVVDVGASSEGGLVCVGKVTGIRRD